MVSQAASTAAGSKDHVATTYNDGLLAWGGATDAKFRLTDMRRFDFASATASVVAASGTIPTGRFGHTGVQYEGYWYMFGGWDGHNTLDETLVYDLANDAWCASDYLPSGTGINGDKPTDRYQHSATLIGHQMFIYGGTQRRWRWRWRRWCLRQQ